MTDLQDAILDRLVGTPVGVNWPDGPLMIAADVVGGKRPIRFGLTDNDRGAKSLISQRLGYPILLIEAVQGVNRALGVENDRRSFAMAVFQAIPVGGRPPKLSSAEQNRIAGRMAIRAHRYVCQRAGCPVPKVLQGLMEAAEVSRAMVLHATATQCPTAGDVIGRGSWLVANSTIPARLLASAYQVVRGFELGRSMGGWCSIRESARLAASERGMAEAFDCCVEIARQCGLPVSPPPEGVPQ